MEAGQGQGKKTIIDYLFLSLGGKLEPVLVAPKGIKIKLPQTGANIAAPPSLRFATWYNALANPTSVVRSIWAPPISRSIGIAVRPSSRFCARRPKYHIVKYHITENALNPFSHHESPRLRKVQSFDPP